MERRAKKWSKKRGVAVIDGENIQQKIRIGQDLVLS